MPRYHSHANGWCHLGHVAVERSWHRSNCWSANWRPRSYLNHHDINILNICYRGTCMTKVIPTRKNENKQIQQNHTVLNEEYPAFIYYATWHYVHQGTHPSGCLCTSKHRRVPVARTSPSALHMWSAGNAPWGAMGLALVSVFVLTISFFVGQTRRTKKSVIIHSCTCIDC